MGQYGRAQIFTDEPTVDDKNLIDVLRKAFKKHEENATAMQKLIDYEAGNVHDVREKTFRKDVNNFVPDPLPSVIVDFKCGFNWGNTITFVQSEDSEDEEKDLTNALTLLNQGYRAQLIRKKQQKLARFIEICGVGYTYIDVNMEWEEGDSFFCIDVFDPRNTFVVRSRTYTDERVVLAVTYRADDQGNKYFTCFTKEKRYDVKNYDSIYDWQMNPLGKIPIIEWIRSHDRQGCFERLIPLMDDLTQNLSDFSNDITQNTDCIWVTTDVELKELKQDENGNTIEVDKNPSSGDWVHIYTTPDGKTPSIKPLTVTNDYQGILKKIVDARAHILSLAHVPQRNDDSGGSTGIAMSDAAGWTDAEAEASREEMLSDSSKMEEVRVVLAAIKISPFVKPDNPLLELNYTDVEPNFKRSKNYELSTKVTAMATLLGRGFALEDVVSAIQLFADPSQVVMRSGDGVKKYQDANVFKEGEEELNSKQDVGLTSDNPINQITNSPMLEGASKQEPIADGVAA